VFIKVEKLIFSISEMPSLRNALIILVNVMIQSTRKRLARSRTTVAAIVIVVAIVVAIVSAWWYYASPVGREEFTLKIKSVAVYGAISGGAFALLAVGFTLSYGVTEVVNLGYGGLFMLGTYIFFVFGVAGWYLHLEALPLLILAPILVGLIGAIFYRSVIHPVVEDPLAPIVTTVAGLIIIQQLILIIFGPAFRPIRFYLRPEDQPPAFNVLGISVPYLRGWAFAVSLILFIALWVFVTRTKIGAAMRAIAQDREVAMLMGINTERVYIITMTISALLAGLAGVIILGSNWETTHPYVWSRPLVLSFAIVILGGLGSIKGSLLGAFIIGFSEKAVVTFVPQGGMLTGAVYLGIMVVVLLLRPKGLFGKHIELE